MSDTIQLDREIDFKLIESHIVGLKDLLNKATKAGAFDLEDAAANLQHIEVFKLVVTHLKAHNDALKQMRRQSELLQKADNVAPITQSLQQPTK